MEGRRKPKQRDYEAKNSAYQKLDINSLDDAPASYERSSLRDKPMKRGGVTPGLASQNQQDFNGLDPMSRSYDSQRGGGIGSINTDREEFFDTINSRSTYSLTRAAEPKMSIMKGGKRPRMSNRTDRNGVTIAKGVRDHKVSFADSVKKDKEKIAEVYVVESFKRFNLENTHGT